MIGKMNFFEALANITGTDMRIQYNDGDWFLYHINRSSSSACLVNEKNSTDIWWPRFFQQKEKLWEVDQDKVKIIKLAPGLDLRKDASGCWLRFEAENGLPARANLNSLPTIARNAAVTWAEEMFERQEKNTRQVS